MSFLTELQKTAGSLYGLPVLEYHGAWTNRGGEKGGRGGGGNRTEAHQKLRMVSTELLHYVGGYTPDSLKDFKSQVQV